MTIEHEHVSQQELQYADEIPGRCSVRSEAGEISRMMAPRATKQAVGGRWESDMTG